MVINGYLAVDLFFMLSGVVIAANYSARIRDVSTSLRFIAQRFFRLYPLHILVLGAFVALEVGKVAGRHTLGIVPEHQPFTGGQSYLVCVANILLIHGLGWVRQLGLNIPSWSISCEFFAYILFAIAASSGLIRSRFCLYGGVVISVVAYTGIAVKYGTLNVLLALGLVRCLAGFFWGVLIYRGAEILGAKSVKTVERYEAPLVVAAIVIMSTTSGAMIVTALPLFVVSVLSLKSDRGPIARVLRKAPLQYLGRISYSIYMVHDFVVVCILMVLKRRAHGTFERQSGQHIAYVDLWYGDVLTVAFVVAVILIAHLTYRYIEEPGRALGRRLLQPKRLEISKPEAMCSSSGAYRFDRLLRRAGDEIFGTATRDAPAVREQE